MVTYLNNEIKWPPDEFTLETAREDAYNQWKKAGTKWVENVFSNFLPLRVPIQYYQWEFPTIEHFYQALKSTNDNYRDAIAKCKTPSKTKFLAHQLDRRGEVREDWHEIKIDIMAYAQKHRIETDPVFYDWLRGTRGELIVEWSNWSDYFWGCSVYTGQGENIMGRILMGLRDLTFFPERK